MAFETPGPEQLPAGNAAEATPDAAVQAAVSHMEYLQLDGAEVQSMPSLCMNCREEGLTRIMLTQVPHFLELVIMAFECPHCHESNNEVQFAGQLQPKGCRLSLRVPPGNAEIRNRQVVKSDSATLTIPELDFEVPPESQKGSLTTVEGVLRKAAGDLRMLQGERRKVTPEVADAIDEFLVKLDACADGEREFTMVLDDPAGNSFIQNPNAPAPDPSLTCVFYDRSAEQNAVMGFLPPPTDDVAPDRASEGSAPPPAIDQPEHSTSAAYVPAGTSRGYPHGAVGAPALAAGAQGSIVGVTGEQADALLRYTSPEEVMVFPGHCSTCGANVEQRMFLTNIPYFKEVIVMAASCDVCGYRSSELKAGGRIPEKGKRIALRVKNIADLSRDLIKSDTASVAIPEVDLELTAGTLGGRVTTVEGLLNDISNSLKRVQAFSLGDSAPVWEKNAWQKFDDKLIKLLDVEVEWTLVLDDALANSFIAPSALVGSLEEDLQLVSEDYERTYDQNEELGLNDISTEDTHANEKLASVAEDQAN